MSPRILLAALGAVVLVTGVSAAELGFDSSAIESITGLKGARNDAEGVFKVSAPRTDVAVKVDGWKMPPFMGLTSWAAFKKGDADHVMVMGDMTLFQDEVNAAMSAALDHGLEVTALHNHFFFDEPRVFFMHIGGEGSAPDLARGVRAVFDAIKQTRADHAEPAKTFGLESMPPQSSISAPALESVFGTKTAAASAGMAKFVFGRETKMECGCDAGKEMGVNTWAAFAGSDENALVDGDFVVKEGELQGVLKSLRHAGVNIVAIHSHMTGENPRMLFLHYWGRGKAADLANAVKAALGTEAK